MCFCLLLLVSFRFDLCTNSFVFFSLLLLLIFFESVLRRRELLRLPLLFALAVCRIAICAAAAAAFRVALF